MTNDSEILHGLERIAQDLDGDAPAITLSELRGSEPFVYEPSTKGSDHIELGLEPAGRLATRRLLAIAASLIVLVGLAGLTWLATRTSPATEVATSPTTGEPEQSAVLDQTDVTGEQDTANAPSPTPAPQLVVEGIEITGSGTTRLVEIAFDSPLPDAEITFVESLDAVDATNQIVYTVQPASEVNVCESVHSFPPPAEGTVDVLIPASWFASSNEPNVGPIERVGQPAKFVPCGPFNGYYQYSVWGPASTDPSDISVTTENGGRRLVISMLQ